MTQLLTSIISLTISAILRAIAYAVIMSYIMTYDRTYRLPNNWLTASIGIASGLLFAGIFAIAHIMISTNMPLWPQYESLACSLPLLATVINTLTHYAQVTIAFSLLFLLIDTATNQWRTHYLIFTAFAAVCGISQFELSSLDLLPIWIIVGSMIGLMFLALYRFVIRYDYALIPLATGSCALLHIIQQGIFNAYPGALFEAIISACTISGISATWYWYINRQD